LQGTIIIAVKAQIKGEGQRQKTQAAVEHLPVGQLCKGILMARAGDERDALTLVGRQALQHTCDGLKPGFLFHHGHRPVNALQHLAQCMPKAAAKQNWQTIALQFLHLPGYNRGFTFSAARAQHVKNTLVQPDFNIVWYPGLLRGLALMYGMLGIHRRKMRRFSLLHHLGLICEGCMGSAMISLSTRRNSVHWYMRSTTINARPMEISTPGYTVPWQSRRQFCM